MKQYLTLILLLPMMWVGALNVRDFGAKGDGVTDDTAAIQAALNEAVRFETFFGAGAAPEMNWGGHGGHGGYAEVFFPAGTYRISNTLVFEKRKIMLTGEAGSVIEQTDPEKDIFYFDRIFRATIRNLTWRGGQRQLYFFTNNNDMTMLDIRDCRFEKSGKFAVSVENWAIDGNITAPYLVSWNNGTPTLTPQDLSQAQWWWNSTELLIRNCAFVDCHEVLEAGCDLTLLTDSTVEMGENAAEAAFRVHGNVNFERVRAYWRTPNQPGRVWIAHGLFRGIDQGNGGHFYGRNLDFDNAGEEGIVFLKTNTRPGYVSTFIRLLDSTVKCAGNEFGSIIRFDPKAQSNILTVTGVEERSGKPVRAVSYAEVPSAEVLENEIRYQPWKSMPANAFFKMKITGNSPSVDPSLPAALEPFRVAPIPASIYEEVSVAEADPAIWPLWDEYPHVNKVEIPDTRNAGESIQAVLDQARPGTRIVLPGTQLMLNQTLRVPPDVAVTGEGMALLVMKEGGTDPLLVVTGPGRNFFADLALAGGRDGVVLASGNAVAAFENCGFFNQTGYGVVAPEMDAVRIAASVFYTGGGLASAARHAELYGNWECNTPQMDQKAFFENHGTLLAAFNLFVPILPRTEIGDGRKIKPEYADIAGGNQVRWFDNYGKLHSRNSRLGGEFMGMTPVYQRSSSGSILLEGGYCWFGNHYTRPCQVYCEQIPSRIVLNDIIGNAEFAKPDQPYNIWVYDAETESDLKNPSDLPVITSGLVMYSK